LGRLAYEALTETCPVALIVSGPVEGVDGNGSLPRVVCTSKLRLLGQILCGHWPPGPALVLHLGLLKLLPFIRGNHRPLCVMLNGIEAWQPQGWLTRRLLKQVDHFLCISKYTWAQFLRFNPSLRDNKHTIVYPGVGAPITAEPLPPEQPPVALILGRLMRGEDYKGHREVIAAWPRVRSRLPGARLWIAGDGDLRPDLEALAGRSDVSGAVRFWGRVSEEHKQDLLRRCRCLVMPSRGEGFGLVYLEAMRLGRPCLVSDVDAGREVVNPPEAGLAANPSDPEALADAVCRLLADGPEWQDWSRMARARYERDFTAGHFQRRLIAALFGAACFTLG